MKTKSLQLGKAISAALFVLLLSVMGMKNALAQQGVLNGVFAINSSGDKVRFSKGNLRYSSTWSFADHQYDCIGTGNTHISQSNSLIDLFSWGTSGYPHGAVCYSPRSTSMNDENYYAYGNSTYNLYDRTGYADWGHNVINSRRWRTLKIEEWIYIINQRNTQSGLRYAKAQVNGMNGLILLPDDWSTSYYTLNYPDQYGVGYNTNVITSSQWSTLENHGAVFLPAAGIRASSDVYQLNSTGAYWSSSCVGVMGFSGNSVGCNNNDRHTGRSVRLVCDVYTISVSPNPNMGGSVTGGGTYIQGQSCTVQATPNTGYVFVNWTENGTSVSTNASYTFNVTGNRTLVANFEGSSYTITATANPTTGGSVSGSGSYSYGSSCTLTATANSGYTFINWTENGNVVSTNANYTFTVTSGGTYVANFGANSYQITGTADPSAGGTITGAGTYNYGASCTLTATAATGYHFVNWTKNGTQVSTNSSYTFTVTETSAYVAHFAINTYTITTSIDPSSGGTTTGDGTYNHGVSCTLTATPATGYTFVNWTKNGSQVSTNTSYSFTVTEAATYVAHFALNSYTITTSANPSSGGTVTGDGVYNHGASCTLTAVPAIGYTFANWTKNGTVVSTNANYTFTVTSSGTYVANFNTNAYQISATADPSMGGTISGAGTYNHFETCTLTATANVGYTFVNWTKDGQEVSTNAAYNFTVTEAIDLVANFQLANYDISATANSAEGGTITGASIYNYGQTCTLTATANEGYIFTNWTRDGEIVSTEPVYSFTVTESATFVANFEEIQVIYYNISANSNPSTGGSVTGAGTYMSGQTCTLTATANEGYTFGSWTENGTTVSTDATYSFTVSNDRTLVANFAPAGNYWTPENISSYSLTMALTGVVQIDGVEQYSDQLEVGVFCGTECRGSQMASEFFLTNRYLVMLSIAGEIGDVLTFKLYDHGLAQELNLTSPDPVTFNADGYGTPIEPYALNFISAFEINATVDPEGAGTVTGAGSYTGGTTCTLVADANPGFQFENWTLDGVLVSTNSTYEFTVNQEASYVAHFQYVHTQALSSGWNWYSTYIEQSGINGLTMLENSLGSNGVRIQSKSNGYVDQFEYNGTSYWYGTLNAITNEQMYMVRTNTACNATMTGHTDTFNNFPITINNGWNWIGFPGNESVGVTTALSGFTPEANDQIKSKNNGYSTYIVYGNNALWYGTLNMLEPGQGYMYKSNSNASKTLIYQNGRGKTLIDNVTVDGNTFLPKDADYAYNMTITAVVEFDGGELRSENYELAAFVGNECRGSVKLMYVEPFDRYMAFLLVSGDVEGCLHFVLTDGNSASWSEDYLMYNNDETVGTPAEPAVLHFGPLGMNENGQEKVQVYPNPSKDVFNIDGYGIRKVEVINAYGQVIYTKEVKDDFVQIDLGNCTVGVYLLRVVTEEGVTTQQIIKK